MQARKRPPSLAPESGHGPIDPLRILEQPAEGALLNPSNILSAGGQNGGKLALQKRLGLLHNRELVACVPEHEHIFVQFFARAARIAE